MDVMLQKHNAKPVCSIPDGLSELCADIAREVIRIEPLDIYCFIAGYLDTLLITRENARVAVRIVENVMLKSEQIVEILSGTGLRLEKIAAAAPRLQKAFRAYLEAVDAQKKECGCDDDSDMGDEAEISICKILKETGASFRKAQCAATKIQALFRGHYERMSLAEKRGEIQWQRAAVNTMEILRKSGITEIEASYAATMIQAAYRGYYTRKNLKLRQDREKELYENSKEVVDMTAWFAMMLENTGLTIERANEAALTIQKCYRNYRERKYSEYELSISSKISSVNEQNEIEEAMGDDIVSAPEEAEQKSGENVSQIKSADDPSAMEIKSVKFEANIADTTVDTNMPVEDIENIQESEELNEDAENEVLNSESTEKIRSADEVEEHKNENNADYEEQAEHESEQV